jgi:hypothetical protein
MEKRKTPKRARLSDWIVLVGFCLREPVILISEVSCRSLAIHQELRSEPKSQLKVILVDR